MEERKELEAANMAQELSVGKSDKTSYIQDKEQKKLLRQRKRRIEEIEERIAEVEAKLEQNEELLCDPVIYQDHEKFQLLNNENQTFQQELSTLMEDWEELQLSIEES